VAALKLLAVQINITWLMAIMCNTILNGRRLAAAAAYQNGGISEMAACRSGAGALEIPAGVAYNKANHGNGGAGGGVAGNAIETHLWLAKI